MAGRKQPNDLLQFRLTRQQDNNGEEYHKKQAEAKI